LEAFHFLIPSKVQQTIKLFKGDILNVKNEYEEYDCVVATEVIEHLQEKDVELFKYLKLIFLMIQGKCCLIKYPRISSY
jgi:2-polyprenyl-3-methyl-5-hydroxy-6-metoxy-1,4-benzoquinol methylase